MKFNFKEFFLLVTILYILSFLLLPAWSEGIVKVLVILGTAAVVVGVTWVEGPALVRVVSTLLKKEEEITFKVDQFEDFQKIYI